MRRIAPTQTGRAGERCALNLAGIEKDAIARGDWIVDARLGASVGAYRCRTDAAADAPSTLKHWAPLHVHLGTTHQVAHVALLDGDTLGCRRNARACNSCSTNPCARCRAIASSCATRRRVARWAAAACSIRLGPRASGARPSGARGSMRCRRCSTPAASTACSRSAPSGLRRSLLEHLTRHAGGCAGVAAGHACGAAAGDDALFIAADALGALKTRLIDALRAVPCSVRPTSRGRTRRACDASRRRWSPMRCGARSSTHAVDERCDCQAQRSVAAFAGAHCHARCRRTRARRCAARCHRTRAFRSALGARSRGRAWCRGRTGAAVAAQARAAGRGVSGRARSLLSSRRDSRTRAARSRREASGRTTARSARRRFAMRPGSGRKRAIQVLEFFDRVGYTRFHRDLHVLRVDSRWLELI